MSSEASRRYWETFEANKAEIRRERLEKEALRDYPHRVDSPIAYDCVVCCDSGRTTDQKYAGGKALPDHNGPCEVYPCFCGAKTG